MSSKSVFCTALWINTALPNVSTKRTCSASEMVKNRDRLNRPRNALSVLLRRLSKEGAAMREGTAYPSIMTANFPADKQFPCLRAAH